LRTDPPCGELYTRQISNANPDAVSALRAPGIPLPPKGDSPQPEVLMAVVTLSP
jgi:hypothetical protein